MSTHEKDTFMPDSSSVDLSEFDDDFAAAESPSLEEVPDGKYQVRIDEVRLDRSQKGDPMIKWDLIVIAGGQPPSATTCLHSGCRKCKTCT